MKFHKKLSAISLGQGQGPRAEAMMRQGMDRGRWVFFQNCHLSPSWMPALERLIEQIDADKVGKHYYKSRLKYHNNLAIGKRCTRGSFIICVNVQFCPLIFHANLHMCTYLINSYIYYVFGCYRFFV